MKYKKILELCDQQNNEILLQFAEYCRELKLPPMSFKSQVHMLLALDENDMLKVVNDTVARGWKSVVYCIDSLNKQSNTSTFKAKDMGTW